MKKFFTQSMGGSLISFYTLMSIIFFIFQFSMIDNLDYINNSHILHHDFYEGYPLVNPFQESKNLKKGSKNNVKNKYKNSSRYNKIKDSKSRPLLFSNKSVSQFLGYISKNNSLYILGFMFFLIFLPVLIFVGYRSKGTSEERNVSKLLKISNQSEQLEDTIKISQNKKINILEKIFPEQNKFSEAIQEICSSCSKEIIKNFKNRVKILNKKDQQTSLSLKSIIDDIKNSFSHEMMSQDISFKVKGDDIFLQESISASYFIFYYTLKKIIEGVPKNGRIEITLHNEKSNSLIIIKDTGYYFSQEKLEKFHSLLNHKNQEFPVDPSSEDIEEVSKICGWKVNENGRCGPFNLTEIRVKPGAPRDRDSKIICLKKARLERSHKESLLNSL